MATDNQIRLARLVPSIATREGRMLAAGSLTVTVTSHRTRAHVTLRFRCLLKHESGGWDRVPYAEASHVFVEDFDGERVATYYPQSGVLFFADNVTDAARWSVQAILRFLAGAFPGLSEAADIDAADFCGRCGRPLTDPVSLERGLGPDCYGELTGSRHAAMWEPLAAAA